MSMGSESSTCILQISALCVVDVILFQRLSVSKSFENISTTVKTTQARKIGRKRDRGVTRGFGIDFASGMNLWWRAIIYIETLRCVQPYMVCCGATTLSTMTFSLMTRSIGNLFVTLMTLKITLSLTTLCHYAECSVLFIVFLNVIILSVVKLNVNMLCVVKLNVIMMSVVMLNVMAPLLGPHLQHFISS
jgi:hypothetical protein